MQVHSRLCTHVHLTHCAISANCVPVVPCVADARYFGGDLQIISMVSNDVIIILISVSVSVSGYTAQALSLNMSLSFLKSGSTRKTMRAKGIKDRD